MSAQDIIRAWRSEEYLLSLPHAERAALPDNPAGTVELSQSDLDGARCTHDCTDCGTCWSGGLCCC